MINAVNQSQAVPEITFFEHCKEILLNLVTKIQEIGMAIFRMICSCFFTEAAPLEPVRVQQRSASPVQEEVRSRSSSDGEFDRCELDNEDPVHVANVDGVGSAEMVEKRFAIGGQAMTVKEWIDIFVDNKAYLVAPTFYVVPPQGCETVKVTISPQKIVALEGDDSSLTQLGFAEIPLPKIDSDKDPFACFEEAVLSQDATLIPWVDLSPINGLRTFEEWMIALPTLERWDGKYAYMLIEEDSDEWIGVRLEQKGNDISEVIPVWPPNKEHDADKYYSVLSMRLG